MLEIEKGQNKQQKREGVGGFLRWSSIEAKVKVLDFYMTRVQAIYSKGSNGAFIDS